MSWRRSLTTQDLAALQAFANKADRNIQTIQSPLRTAVYRNMLPNSLEIACEMLFAELDAYAPQYWLHCDREVSSGYEQSKIEKLIAVLSWSLDRWNSKVFMQKHLDAHPDIKAISPELDSVLVEIYKDAAVLLLRSLVRGALDVPMDVSISSQVMRLVDPLSVRFDVVITEAKSRISLTASKVKPLNADVTMLVYYKWHVFPIQLCKEDSIETAVSVLNKLRQDAEVWDKSSVFQVGKYSFVPASTTTCTLRSDTKDTSVTVLSDDLVAAIETSTSDVAMFLMQTAVK
jgi:hypothetical protein